MIVLLDNRCCMDLVSSMPLDYWIKSWTLLLYAGCSDIQVGPLLVRKFSNISQYRSDGMKDCWDLQNHCWIERWKYFGNRSSFCQVTDRTTFSSLTCEYPGFCATLYIHTEITDFCDVTSPYLWKSSAVAEMGDRGHNRHGLKRVGDCGAPFAGGAGSLSNTVWPGPRFTSVPSGVFIHPAVWPQYKTCAENWGLCPFLGAAANWGGAGAWSTSKAMSLRPRSTSIPSGILIHPAVWPQRTWANIGGCVPLGEGELRPHLTQCRLGWGLPPYQVVSWCKQP